MLTVTACSNENALGNGNIFPGMYAGKCISLCVQRTGSPERNACVHGINAGILCLDNALAFQNNRKNTVLAFALVKDSATLRLPVHAGHILKRQRARGRIIFRRSARHGNFVFVFCGHLRLAEPQRILSVLVRIFRRGGRDTYPDSDQQRQKHRNQPGTLSLHAFFPPLFFYNTLRDEYPIDAYPYCL